MGIDATLANTQVNVGARVEKMSRFNASQGHGFAAEQYNDLIDKLCLHKATIVGDDNAKNGADRKVDGQFIQTKYCQNAQASINAAFNNKGQFRYFDKTGKPMQIEVPADQYDQAVKIMEQKIRDGKVSGVTDVKEAKNWCARGMPPMPKLKI